MSNQTLLNNGNNRDKKDIKALENELRSIWLTTIEEVITAIKYDLAGGNPDDVLSTSRVLALRKPPNKAQAGS